MRQKLKKKKMFLMSGGKRWSKRYDSWSIFLIKNQIKQSNWLSPSFFLTIFGVNHSADTKGEFDILVAKTLYWGHLYLHLYLYWGHIWGEGFGVCFGRNFKTVYRGHLQTSPGDIQAHHFCYWGRAFSKEFSSLKDEKY